MHTTVYIYTPHTCMLNICTMLDEVAGREDVLVRDDRTECDLTR